MQGKNSVICLVCLISGANTLPKITLKKYSVIIIGNIKNFVLNTQRGFLLLIDSSDISCRLNNFPDAASRETDRCGIRRKFISFLSNANDYVIDAESEEQRESTSRTTKLVEAETYTGAHITPRLLTRRLSSRARLLNLVGSRYFYLNWHCLVQYPVNSLGKFTRQRSEYINNRDSCAA